MVHEHNWADNYTYTAAGLSRPESVEQLQELVRSSPKVRALGSRHSFNAIADTPGDLVSTEKLDRVLALDADALTVTIQGGIRYGQLAELLYERGYALANMASLPHISVAGACATATHGSGDRNATLATAVSALRLVRADGELVTLSGARPADRLDGAVVGLGGLGIVVELTLDIVPAYEVRQLAYLNLPFAQLDRQFDEITAHAYSISLFTDWREPRFNLALLKQQVDDATAAAAPSFYQATLATEQYSVIGGPTDRWTTQGDVAGPWHERLPHFRMQFTPSSGEELQTEYFVARRDAVEAIRALGRIGADIAPLLLICEVRTVAADRLWMSMCYERESVGLHFTWKKDWPAVSRLLPRIEAALAPFDARPHWGKLFTMPPEQVQAGYTRMGEFRELARSLDPDGKFRNAFWDTFIGEVG